MRPRLRPLVLAAVALVGGAGLALASDEAAFKDLEARYKKLSRNKDDAANRDRRKILLATFDHLDLKNARKFLRDAYGEEPTPDGRVTVVQVLGASGDPKDIDFLLAAFKKERSAGPPIALGQGISYTAAESAAAVSTYAVGLAAKQKGEASRALLEGVGELGAPEAFAALQPLAGKLEPAAEFERVIALGACGGAKAKDVLDRASVSTNADVRLAATIGLGRTGGFDKPPADAALASLVALAADPDPRVVEAAAEALGRTKHAAAVAPLADALARTPLRTREAIRAALRAITGRDAGHDAEAWKKEGGTAPAPAIPSLAGTAVPTDQVAIVLDLSRSMDWNGRIEEARRRLTDLVRSLPDDAAIGVVAAGRNPAPMSDKLVAGTQGKQQAEAFLAKQLTAGGSDIREALLYVVRQWPSLDTIVVATDSAPWGDSAELTPLATIQEFRRENRQRRMRVFVAFTAPGGRYVASETDADEYEERKVLVKQLAEVTGGAAVILE